MIHEISVNLGNVLLSFSDAIDLANDSIASHQMRTAFICWQMANAAELPLDEKQNLFIGAILHDVGALTAEDKMEVHNFDNVDPEPHCILGADLYESCSLLKESSQIVRWHHKPWSKWETSIDSKEVFGSQVLFLADHLERSIKQDQYILHQNEKITEKIISMSGSEISPEVVDLFVATSNREDFWLDLVSPRLYSTLLHFGPLKAVDVESDQFLSIATFFRNLIDFKSPFTSTHSTGVAECAAILARIFGLTKNEIFLIKLAGYFHDLGKLAIPNSILEKPDRLTKDEIAVMRQHTYFTYMVLKSIGGLGQIPEWAAFHHENLDGSGYPFHIDGEKMDTATRILAVADIFTALAEDRPYRAGMQRDEIEKILRGMSERKEKDENIVNLLFDNYEEVLMHVREKQAITSSEYRGLVRTDGPSQTAS
jgi:HD-GYP domain-containing protein (c-di-GMP phosphodiesterase class II)